MMLAYHHIIYHWHDILSSLGGRFGFLGIYFEVRHLFLLYILYYIIYYIIYNIHIILYYIILYIFIIYIIFLFILF